MSSLDVDIAASPLNTVSHLFPISSIRPMMASLICEKRDCICSRRFWTKTVRSWLLVGAPSPESSATGGGAASDICTRTKGGNEEERAAGEGKRVESVRCIRRDVFCY